MDHITGRAPFAFEGVCILTGCKKTTVELWASKGSWVLGVGGNKTGSTEKLVYAMQVKENMSFSKFRRIFPQYLASIPGQPGTQVLISRKFYYFGEPGIALPKELTHIMIRRQGCKRLSESDVALIKILLARYPKNFCRAHKMNTKTKACK